MDGPRLSEEARRSLEERLRVLDEERIPRLERELRTSGDVSIAAALRASRDEVSRVQEALASASPMEEAEHDPTVVELGDTVTVRREGSSERERFTLVGELESRLDDAWVSVESIGVSAPQGTMRYQVLGIERTT